MIDTQFPSDIRTLLDQLAAVSGVAAVVLGGSRAEGAADERSDWDLGLYYRGELDMKALDRLGRFHPPGSWGRIMNGGAWLTIGGAKVDVLLRDVAVLDQWSNAATEGVFEIDALLGYLAGVPTYSLAAERSVAKVVRGDMSPPLAFPPVLKKLGFERWRFNSRFSIDYAKAFAKRGDVMGAIGQATKAVFEEGHARMCAKSHWGLNEKRLVKRAGLTAAGELFRDLPQSAAALDTWIGRLSAALEGADH